MIHTVKGFGVVNKTEVDVFLELFCFFDNPTNVGTLISGSSAFSKSSLNFWNFSVHMLLKPSLEKFEHYLTSMWNAGLDEAQAGIKIARRIINNFRYADGTTLMAKCEELKSLLIKVKEDSEKLA